MARNGSGEASFPAGTRGAAGTVIESAPYNAMLDDAEAMLSESINKDGTVPFDADQSMGGNNLTGLADGTTNNHAATVKQAQAGTLHHATVVAGTVNSIELTFSPAFLAYTAGMKISWISAGPNVNTTPDVTVDALSAKGLRKYDTVVLAAGDTGPAGYACYAIYDGTRFLLLNPYTLARTDAANTFAADQTIQSADAGATVGPILSLDRFSASPANSDLIGGIEFKGRDSAANTETYARIFAEILDVTSTTEDAALRIRTVTAGTLSDVLRMAAGVYTPGMTDKGVDTINAGAFYVNGVLKKSEILKAANETVTGSTSFQADDELLFSMLANTRYSFNFEIFYVTTAAADFKFELDSTGATDPTSLSINYEYLAPAGTQYFGGNHTAMNTNVTILSGSSGDGHIRISGWALNGADAGSFRLRWAQNTSDAGNTTVFRGSSIAYRVI